MDFARIKNQFIGELKANRKKAALLALLAVVALFLVVRLAVKSGGSPARAKAEPAAVASAPQAPAPSAPDTRSRRDRRDAREQYLEQFDATIERDLFEPNERFFPRPKVVQEPSEPKPELPPAVPEQPSGPTEAEIRRAAIGREAQGLELQMTVVSSPPVAMINGRSLGLGDRINGFEVVRITSDSCDVRKEDVELTLVLRR